MRPVVTVYNSPVLPSEPSSRRPVQPLRARPSSPAEPVALRQPAPQPFRARPRSLAAPEWRPCGLLAGNPLESFPSPTGFLTGRERSVERRLRYRNPEHLFKNKFSIRAPSNPPSEVKEVHGCATSRPHTV